jgi:hypothetical protein
MVFLGNENIQSFILVLKQMRPVNLEAVISKFKIRGIYSLHLQSSKVSHARICKEAGNKQHKPSNSSCRLHHFTVLLGSFFDPEDGSSAFLRNVGGHLLEYMALHPSSE